MEDHEVRARGAKARQELELTDQAFAGLRQAALEEIVATSPDQVAKRERLVICAQLIDAVRKALQASIDAGEVANYRLMLAEQNLIRP